MADKTQPREGRRTTINRPEYDSLRAVLRACVQASGLSQREVSLGLGRGEEYLNRILVGRRTLEWIELIELCRAIGVEPLDVLTRALKP